VPPSRPPATVTLSENIESLPLMKRLPALTTASRMLLLNDGKNKGPVADLGDAGKNRTGDPAGRRQLAAVYPMKTLATAAPRGPPGIVAR